jgi:hypothetical protein
MMREESETLWIFLASACICLAEPSSSDKTRSDGMVDIGGILYPEENAKNPESRKKAEQLAHRIESLKGSDSQFRNYSDMSTPDLLITALDTMSNATWEAALIELSKRPEETKKAIDEMLDEKKPYSGAVMFFYRLPSVASRLGVDYEVIVTKKILEHPLVKQNDKVFLNDALSDVMGSGFLEHLAASGEDETKILDKLIAEGRVVKDSEFEVKWRKRLAGTDKTQTRPEKKGQEAGNDISLKVSGKPTGRGDQYNDAFGEWNSYPWKLIIPGVLLLGILLFLKTSKGKSAS